LHWIDSETQALLDSLVESLPTAQLLLLVNYRPEYQHGWGSKTFYTQLRLDPLPPASAAAVLQTLLGDDARLMPLTRLLIARTEGNPFFLEESVRTLSGHRGRIGWCNRSTLSTCPRLCRRSWRAAWTACPPRTNAPSRPPPALAPRRPCPWRTPLPSCPKTPCTASSRTCRQRSPSMRRASFPSTRTPLSTPSPTRSPMAASCWNGGGRCMRGLLRPSRGSLPTASPSRWNAWPTMPCR